jgi:hypothetical protein
MPSRHRQQNIIAHNDPAESTTPTEKSHFIFNHHRRKLKHLSRLDRRKSGPSLDPDAPVSWESGHVGNKRQGANKNHIFYKKKFFFLVQGR